MNRLWKKKTEVNLFELRENKNGMIQTLICNAHRLHSLRKLYIHFLSNRMGYGRGDSFPFYFEPNGIPYGSKLKGKLSPRPYPIRFERKWMHSSLSAPHANIAKCRLNACRAAATA